MIDYHIHLAHGPYGLIIADPPWGYQRGMTFARGDARQSRATTQPLLPYPTFQTLAEWQDFLASAAAALLPHRTLWVWCDWKTHATLLDARHAVPALTYQGICVVARTRMGLGYFLRKQAYYLAVFSTGSIRFKPGAKRSMSEWLGSHACQHSTKPLAVYQRIIDSCLFPDERWTDPFPNTHDVTYAGLMTNPRPAYDDLADERG